MLVVCLVVLLATYLQKREEASELQGPLIAGCKRVMAGNKVTFATRTCIGYYQRLYYDRSGMWDEFFGVNMFWTEKWWCSLMFFQVLQPTHSSLHHTPWFILAYFQVVLRFVEVVWLHTMF